jgi:HSP20 family protein
MPFFPQAYLSSEANLLQLLSELDVPQQRKACGPRRTRHQTFTPNFDVAEVAEAYELYGELPGLVQDDISIEFTDAQTLVIKGKTERASTTTPAAEAAHTQPESSKDAETLSEKSHNATVEDEYDEADTPLATPATTATAANEAAPQQEQVETPRAKFWVAERRVGEFARSFSFSQRIEQDFVTATLKNGVLHVVVPKSQKPRKINVNVY